MFLGNVELLLFRYSLRKDFRNFLAFSFRTFSSRSTCSNVSHTVSTVTFRQTKVSGRKKRVTVRRKKGQSRKLYDHLPKCMRLKSASFLFS